MSFRTLEWRGDRLVLLDQTLLPGEEVYREYTDYRSVALAISDMVVRGAPAIGVAAAFGAALAARSFSGLPAEAFFPAFEVALRELAETRPTAVNLFWALGRMRETALAHAQEPSPRIAEVLADEAQAICREDVDANRRLGAFGADLLPDPCTVLTHCNAGALATAGYGTALGVVRAARDAGKRVHVIADETRPFLQG
jgi:methylthioribose-1-phosphate isomerase